MTEKHEMPAKNQTGSRQKRNAGEASEGKANWLSIALLTALTVATVFVGVVSGSMIAHAVADSQFPAAAEITETLHDNREERDEQPIAELHGEASAVDPLLYNEHEVPLSLYRNSVALN